MPNNEPYHPSLEPLDTDLWIVDQAIDGWRCDKLLAHHYGDTYSRAYFQNLIERGYVKINGIPLTKKGLFLKAGTQVEVHFAALPPLDLLAEAIPLDILYEDEELLVLNKPAGMVVHPAHGHWQGTLVNALLHHCCTTQLWQEVAAATDWRPGIVHRLDKDTSGLLVAAKTTTSLRLLKEAFAERKVQKRYLAICTGNPGTCTLTGSIGRHPKDRYKMAVLNTGGKAAVTHCLPLYSNGKLTVVLASPHTGRTHQIRVHLQHANCAIVGDSLYASPSHSLTVQRQMLHAWQLTFQHPISQQPLTFSVPPPPDITDFLAKHLPNYRPVINYG